jgi:hypothetical protein
MKRTDDLKNYIASKYPRMDIKKFDIAKIGARVYIYFIDAEGNLQREVIFRGSLPMTNELAVLRNLLAANINAVLEKWNFI